MFSGEREHEIMKQKIILNLLMILGFLTVAGSFTAEAQKLSNNKFKTWKISDGQSGGIAGRIENYSISSDGNSIEQANMKTTTQKIDETDLQEIVGLLEELKLPGTKTKLVKGSRIYDGVYGGLTITLDGKDYKIEGNSFYDEKQIVLTAAQKKTLDQLKRKLAQIRTKPVKNNYPVQQEIPSVMTGKVWTITIFRRKPMYSGGDFAPYDFEITIFWRGKLTRRENSFIFDAVWRNELTAEEVCDTVELADTVLESIVLRRSGEANKNLGEVFRGKYKKAWQSFISDGANLKEMPQFIGGGIDKSDLLWEAKIKTESNTSSKVDIADSNQINSSIKRTDFAAPLDPEKQKMVFRYEYWNIGRNKGWYMDELGDIYKYSYQPNKDGFVTPPTLIGRVAAGDLAEKRKLIEQSAKGNIRKQRGGYDRGTHTIVAFLIDERTGKYREVLLTKHGDFEVSNDTPEAALLVDWLTKVIAKLQF
jgi:hypothetical protein